MIVLAGGAFSTNGWEKMIIREQRVGLRSTSAYKKQLPVLLEIAIAGPLCLTARLHLTKGGTGTRLFGDIY